MQLSNLLSGLEYELVGIEDTAEIFEPVTNSRDAVPGSLFICIDGTKSNGTDFVSDAVKNGAAAAVCRNEVEGIPYIKVKNTRHAAAVIWNNYYGEPAKDMRAFAVTGTNGKTSTLCYLAAILTSDGRKAATIGTLGIFAGGEKLNSAQSETDAASSAMTTPDPKYLYGALAEMKRRGVTDVVMEASSHALSQNKLDAVDFECGIFTNLSPEHLDYHGDMEEYFSNKAKLFDRCRKAVYNGEDPYGKRFGDLKIPSFCLDRKKIGNITCFPGATSFSLDFEGETIDLAVRQNGDFAVFNSAAAAACALMCGVTKEAVRDGILSVETLPGRMEKVASADIFGIDVFIDYAHTPAAMEAVLQSFHGNGNICAVFGCGGERDREKRPAMGRIAEKYCKRVVLTEDNPRSENKLQIMKEVLYGMGAKNRVCLIPEREKAIRFAIENAEPGDTVILFGKGHETYMIDSSGKHDFSEKDIVADEMKKKFCNS